MQPFLLQKLSFFLHDKEKLKVISLFYLYKPSKNALVFFYFLLQEKTNLLHANQLFLSNFQCRMWLSLLCSIYCQKEKKCQKLLITGMRRSKRGLAVRPRTGRIDRGLLGRPQSRRATIRKYISICTLIVLFYHKVE